MTEYIITGEGEALSLLNLIKTDKIQLNDEVIIIFDKWPLYFVRLEGEDFHGSVPTRVLPPLLDFQKTIHAIYADIYYEGNPRRLTKEDRDKLELILTIEQGSSIFQAFLDKVLTEAIKPAGEAIKNMESRHLMIAILGAALAIGTSVGFKAYLRDRLETTKHVTSEQTKIALSKEETERHQILVQATQGNPYLTEDRINGIHESKAQMLQVLKEEDKVHFLGDVVVDGTDAKQIAKKERPDLPKDVRLDGKYRILGVITTLKEGFNLKLKNTDTGVTFQAIVEQENLTGQGKSMLKEATYEKEEIELQINAQIVDEQIKNAKIMKL